MTQSTKTPELIRRLSLSSPSTSEAVGSRSSRQTGGDWNSPRSTRPIGSPVIQLPPGAAPSSYGGAKQDDQSLKNHRVAQLASAPSPGDFAPARSNTASAMPSSVSNSVRPRQPIYPALAIPPNSPPHQSPPSRRDPAWTNPVDPLPPQRRIPNSELALTIMSGSSSTSRSSRYADADGVDVFSSQPLMTPGTRRTVSSRPSVKASDSADRMPPSSFSPSSLPPNAGSPVSEARAYASAMASTTGKDAPIRQGATSAPPMTSVERLNSRPLPRPPSHSYSEALSHSNSETSLHAIATNDRTGGRDISPLCSPKPRPKIIIPREDRPTMPMFDFPRSPTLPPLVDPRTVHRSAPIDEWSASKTLTAKELPSRTPSVSKAKAASVSANIFGASSQLPEMSSRSKSFSSLLSHPQVQTSLLSYLSINSFLSLTGASESIRRCFTGELVGRWVMREWGVQVDRERGRSWPNLTVWEGFQSLLHDPATYSTYPAQWHNLLRHLSLSHTLIVLHLRSLPSTSFPNLAPIPFEEEAISHSNSTNSFPRSRVGSDAGSIMSSQVPKKERLMEIVMPEPLASKPDLESSAHGTPVERKVIRRSSISSIASAASFSFGRRRSNSTASASVVPSDVVATPMASGKADLPPVSYPSAKRYGFKRHGDPPSSMRQRTFSETSRPGSIRSMQSSTHSVALSQWVSSNRQAQFMPPAVPSNRASLTSARSGQSPVHRYGSPLRRDCPTPKAEPAFDKPLPYVQGRVPILRVFVPLSEQVQRWPSAEGAAAAIAELDKCGATRRLRLGDLIVNTAVRQPKTTEHVLVYIPTARHMLLPLEYRYSATGHLPPLIDGFSLPPSYYYPFLANPQIVYLDLRPFAERGIASLRLAFDRSDMTIASGARLTAKRYLYVAGFEVKDEDALAAEWRGTVSLEAEGTAEAKASILERFAAGRRYPWELVREKSMSGLVWLKLVKE